MVQIGSVVKAFKLAMVIQAQAYTYMEIFSNNDFFEIKVQYPKTDISTKTEIIYSIIFTRKSILFSLIFIFALSKKNVDRKTPFIAL